MATTKLIDEAGLQQAMTEVKNHFIKSNDTLFTFNGNPVQKGGSVSLPSLYRFGTKAAGSNTITLPEASESTMGHIYLIPSADTKNGNIYTEYITVKGSVTNPLTATYSWEKIGEYTPDITVDTDPWLNVMMETSGDRLDSGSGTVLTGKKFFIRDSEQENEFPDGNPFAKKECVGLRLMYGTDAYYLPFSHVYDDGDPYGSVDFLPFAYDGNLYIPSFEQHTDGSYYFAFTKVDSAAPYTVLSTAAVTSMCNTVFGS